MWPVSWCVLILNLNFEQKEIRELYTKLTATGICEYTHIHMYDRLFSLCSGIFRPFNALCVNVILFIYFKICLKTSLKC